MKKQHKGLFFVVIFGGGLLFWATAASVPGITPTEIGPERTITGTPADNFADEERAQFCGSGMAGSNEFVREYSIPTECTNPLAITSDYDGNVWFTQTNTGKVAKFDPSTERFTEYENPSWPEGARSMMWGIDYAPDGSVWFTDEVFDMVWTFSTVDETYQSLSYPSEGNSLPQKLLIDGSQVIINDFTGNKIAFLRDTSQSGEEPNYIILPSPVDNSVTGDFAIDADDNIWYTNWLLHQGGALVKFDQSSYDEQVATVDDQFLPLGDFIEIYGLPAEMITPNGVTVDNDGLVWIADTSSSSFFSFDPSAGAFTQYVTADPLPGTYGNQTGVSKTPLSRPYWIDTDDMGRLVFNAHTANIIAVMDPRSESLVEYQIPSRNPHWADCDPGTGLMIPDCGLAQAFDFAVVGDKIWFTEWVENNIGVVDTSLPLPVEILPESETLSLAPGDSHHFNYVIRPQSAGGLDDIFPILSSTRGFLGVSLHDDPETFQLDSDESRTVSAVISASEDAQPGTYKVLLGAQSSDVSVSRFVTVNIR